MLEECYKDYRVSKIGYPSNKDLVELFCQTILSATKDRITLDDKCWFGFQHFPFKFEIVGERKDMVIEILRALVD